MREKVLEKRKLNTISSEKPKPKAIITRTVFHDHTILCTYRLRLCNGVCLYIKRNGRVDDGSCFMFPSTIISDERCCYRTTVLAVVAFVVVVSAVVTSTVFVAGDSVS